MNRRFVITAVMCITCFTACESRNAIPRQAMRYESRGVGAGVRFTPVQVLLESLEREVAAYQVEVVVIAGEAEIVGVEGADHPGFQDAPYYDPAALAGGRIIIAAFSTKHQLPIGKQRVATIHMRESGPERVAYEIRTIALADKRGKPVSAKVLLEESSNDRGKQR